MGTRIFFKPATNLLSSWWRFGNQHWLIIRSTAANDQSLMKMIRLFATVRVRVLELAELVSKCSENCEFDCCCVCYHDTCVCTLYSFLIIQLNMSRRRNSAFQF